MNPIRVRGFLYVALAALPVFISYLTGIVDKITEGKPVVFHTAIWALLACNASYQSLLAYRAYIDGTVEKAKNEKAP